MAHCPGCDDPQCQGVDHSDHITIPKDEFEKIIFYLKGSIVDPMNPAKMALSRLWLKTLSEYDVEACKKASQDQADIDRVDNFGNRY